MTFSARTRAWLAPMFPLVAAILPLGCPPRPGPDGAGPAATRPGPLPAGVVALGRIVPGERVIHVSGPTAVVKDLLVKRHDQVRKGQVLALLLDHETSAAALAQATLEVEVASRLLTQAKAGEKAGTLAAQDAAVASAAAALDNAETTCARTRTLFEQGILPRAQMDEAQTALAQAREGLRQAKERYLSLTDIRPVDLAVFASRLESAVATQRKAKADLDLTEIRAPMDGRIIAINTYPGEAIGAGGLLDMGDTADMMVDAEVDVLDIGRVRKGGPTRISGEGMAAEMTGKVEEIFGQVAANAVLDPEPLANADLRVVRVRIRPDRARDLEGLVNAVVSVRFLP